MRILPPLPGLHGVGCQEVGLKTITLFRALVLCVWLPISLYASSCIFGVIALVSKSPCSKVYCALLAFPTNRVWNNLEGNFLRIFIKVLPLNSERFEINSLAIGTFGLLPVAQDLDHSARGSWLSRSFYLFIIKFSAKTDTPTASSVMTRAPQLWYHIKPQL